MRKPVILTVDDDLDVLHAIERDLKKRYEERYRVLRAESGRVALDLLRRLQQRNDPVALLLVDHRMPQMNGVEMLQEAIKLYPNAKRTLLTAYADTDAAIKAINDVQLNHYLLKPWDPPEQQLFPVLDDLLNDWYADFHPPFEGIRVLGTRWSSKSYEVRSFLARNQVPYQWLDADAAARDEEVKPSFDEFASRRYQITRRAVPERRLCCRTQDPGSGGKARPKNTRRPCILRSRDRWRWPCWTRCGCLWRVRRLKNNYGGEGSPGRSGGTKFPNRELPRFSIGTYRRRPYSQGGRPGAALWSGDSFSAGGYRPPRRWALPLPAPERRNGAVLSRHAIGHGRPVAQARYSWNGPLAGGRASIMAARRRKRSPAGTKMFLSSGERIPRAKRPCFSPNMPSGWLCWSVGSRWRPPCRSI